MPHAYCWSQWLVTTASHLSLRGLSSSSSQARKCCITGAVKSLRSLIHSDVGNQRLLRSRRSSFFSWFLIRITSTRTCTQDYLG